MQIYVDTDTNIDSGGTLTAYVESEVAAALSRFSGHITRIEVHLSDESGDEPTAPQSDACSRHDRRVRRRSP